LDDDAPALAVDQPLAQELAREHLGRPAKEARRQAVPGERRLGRAGSWTGEHARSARALQVIDRSQIEDLTPERQLLGGELVAEKSVARLDRPAAREIARKVNGQRVPAIVVDGGPVL